MKDIYEPDNEDILEWVKDAKEGWPASDWDYYVMNGKNDELVFNLANDIRCPKSSFFLHSLYYLVGDYYNSGCVDKTKYGRIMNLMNMVNSKSTADIHEWKSSTVNLLSQNMKFDPVFWLNYLFRNDG
jgi:hypothetical protein